MSRIRIAVVGLGMAARPHFLALTALQDEVELAGVYSRTLETTEARAARLGCKAYTSPQAIAEDPTVDAVLLLTPPNQRVELVKLFAAAGKHILCEKPLERDLEAARQIVKICHKTKVKLGVVFQNRFKPGALHLKKLMDENALGDLALVRATVPWWRDQAYYDEPGRGTYERDGGGVLITQAIHLLDIMLDTIGPVAHVQALCGTSRLHDLEAEDFCSAGFEFEGGALGNLLATTATFPSQPESLIIDGTKGTALLQGEQLVLHWRDGIEERIGNPPETGDGTDPMDFSSAWHEALIKDFAGAIREDRSPNASGGAALEVHALIAALTESSEKGTKLTVPSTGFYNKRLSP
ncbi:Gfo/Idh/MocA family oxidoreductase [Pseudovibrio exalbescens]|uniref:Gfo/Idh/MocA family protein n=1 Tax=Pseudovibrio exalbescens TaxID=197461 RepID=UPI0023651FB0|nr:Gfo/Idh/MocA family oxidoreductase [Pseudovibrio exalbescens]MDD7911679.1 Gfo/Idh/MocA family oxidoreductase [Pseudovibrio exalbescens]